jgi:hypothetical protein
MMMEVRGRQPPNGNPVNRSVIHFSAFYRCLILRESSHKVVKAVININSSKIYTIPCRGLDQHGGHIHQLCDQVISLIVWFALLTLRRRVGMNEPERVGGISSD